ncbi:MAG: hypothetical protein CBC13_11890 [Planctomycetia bacterium TMED53]|nr:MAG: hypothetical protein CBC13_11890 [Planctomycetia bacterium TMED53]
MLYANHCATLQVCELDRDPSSWPTRNLLTRLFPCPGPPSLPPSWYGNRGPLIDPEPKFCHQCGSPLTQEIPQGEDRLRGVCKACGMIHYVNPRVVVGTVIESGNRILLCRRAIEPAHGKWTPPAGFLEVGESTLAGATRETWEEARAEVEILQPLVSIDLTRIGQIHIKYLAKMKSDDFEAGPESLEVRWFDYSEIPWDDLAFPVTHWSLRLRIQDRDQGSPHFHRGTLQWNQQGSPLDFSNYDLSDLQSWPLDIEEGNES